MTPSSNDVTRRGFFAKMALVFQWFCWLCSCRSDSALSSVAGGART